MARPGAVVRVLVAFVLAAPLAGAVSLRLVPARAADARLLCGNERWSVKTLADRPRLLPLRATTISYLVNRHVPAELPATRLPFEHHVFWLLAAVTLVRPEQDGDLHLVLSDGIETMIAESPASACTAGATSRFRREMSVARSRVRLCARARVSGVAFFDFGHGQPGVAPNAIELHPVLGFRCLASV